ncbi:6,7-dimethyl-8-ribityllumazine synthase [Patescibacteria group bacterium]
MKKETTDNSDYTGENVKVAIVYSQFNEEIVEKLLSGTINELERLQTKEIKTFKVPGALEIPVVAKKIIEKNEFDVIIALGAIIKGGTTHFEHVSTESIHALSILSLQTGVPIISGILTALDENQANERIDRGKEFAQSALHTVHTLKSI